MVKRLALVVCSLWAVLYVSDWLVSRLFDLLRAPLADSPWALALALAAPATVAVWLVGRMHAIAGGRLAATSLLAVLAAILMWIATGWILTLVPLPSSLGDADKLAMASLYLVYALETVLAAQLVAGVMSDRARLTSASA